LVILGQAIMATDLVFSLESILGNTNGHCALGVMLGKLCTTVAR
jgi:hypothetical protein